MAGQTGDGKPTVQQKRRMYVVFFVIAFGIDLIVGLVRYGTYVPTLVGLAIMITAALFFVFSLIRDR
jgi:type IV secretory pathway VirB2 component (pilin)